LIANHPACHPALLICAFNLPIRDQNILRALPTLLAAAANGGITALACLPDTRPVIDEASAIDSLCLRASRIGGSRLYAYGAATKSLAGTEMAELGLMAEAWRHWVYQQHNIN
jgi:dihydroorotase-like cyclic amidohydrolase